MDWSKTKYFKNGEVEFRCKCGCGMNEMDEGYVLKLDALRDRCGFAFIINSGYRCPDHNDKVSSTGRTGPHTTGHASDIRLDRGRVFIAIREAIVLGFTGLGFQQKGSSRFLHLDDLSNRPNQPRPTVWSY